MAGTSAALELSKVKFGGKPLKLNDDDWSSGDETESDVTEPDEDASEPTYFPGTSSSTTLVKSQETDEYEGEKGADEVDAIRWARYRDSRGIRPDGKVGWHYCVMWTGYLKTASDTEEFITSFDTDENGQNQLVTDFWDAVGRPMRKNKRGRIIEPLGAIGEVMEPSKDLIKRWIKDARPRRSFKLYKIRAEREKSIPPQKIRKRDSDYYYHKRLVLRAEAEKLRESQLVSADSTQQGDAGPSTQASRTASLLSHITATPSSQSTEEHKDGSGKSKLVGKAIVKGKGKAKEEKPVDPALVSLFEDDVIVAVDTPEGSETRKKKKKKEKNKDGLRDGSINDSPAPSENGSKKEKKRKRESGLAESSTPGPSGQRRSPEKKKRVSSPIKPNQPVPPTPQVVPPTPITAGIKIKIVPTHQEHRAGSSGPSRSAPSPTPPTIPRRPQQEPLFLDAAPSPADTFGEPMPGFFDSRPQSRISSLSLSQPKSIPASLPTPLLTAKIEPVDPEPSQRALGRGTAGISNHADTVIDLDEQEEEEEESVNNALLDPVILERPKSRSKSKSPSPLPPVAKVTSAVPRSSTAVVDAGETVPAPEKIQTAPPSNSGSPHASTESATKDVLQKDPPSAPLPSLAPTTAIDVSVPSLPNITHPTAPSSEVSPATVGKASLPTATAPSVPMSNKADSSYGPGSTTDAAVKSLTVTPAGTSEQGGDTIAPAQPREPSPVRAPIGRPTSIIDSPPMEPPVPTFVSPRKVSRSPSLPMDMDMDISSSPIQPPETEDRNPEGGISPPRYILNSPDKVQTLPPPPSKPPSPVRIKIPISERPKYVQPSRIQVLADIVDPEAAARQARLAAKKGPPPPLMHAHPSLPDRPTPVSAPIHPSRLALVEGGNRGPVTAPVQPRGFGPTPPSGPSGPRQSGPLADQKEAYKGVRPPWEKRKRGADVSGGQSPMIHAPPGPSAMRTDQWRPAPQVPYLPYGGQSPAWAPNPMGANPYTAVPPVIAGRSPMYGVQPHVPQSVDPRGGASPALSLMSPNPALYADGHPQSIDPRRRGSDQPGLAPGQSPLHTPMSPVANSGSIGPRRITQLGRIAAYLKSPHIDAEETRFSLNIMQGAFNGFMLEGDRVLGMVLANKGTSKPVDMPMDEVDSSLIGWQMRYGAKLVQWAKVGLAGGPPAEWEQFKMKAMQRGRAWVTSTENLAPDNTVMEHFAIIMAPAKFVEQSILALGLGPWSTVSEIGIALLVLAIPLDTFPPPMIPNPVRPDIDVEEDKKVPNTVVTPTHLFASYGLSPEYFRSLRQTRAVRYPGQEGHYDVLHFLVEHEFSVNDVIPYDEFHAPENVLFMNNKLNRAVKSSTLDKTVNRRTRYFSTGPALHLLPSQWRLREIWSTGGLVTFSPTFILRSPEKVAEIMSMIRIAPNWAAYVTPQVVQWVNASWRLPARCPNPTLAYQTFTQSLFLDQNLLNLSGSPAAAGGGLAVSTCPPLMSHSERCARWLEWLQQSSTATDYQTLVDLCHDYVRARGPGTGTGKTGMENELDLELVDIEKKQLEDLTNMRKSPHLLPYRRYIFIGEVSLPKDKKDRYGAGIEYVDPDSFAAIFSGAI